MKKIMPQILPPFLSFFSALLFFLSGGFMSDKDSRITEAVGIITAVIGLIKLIISVFGGIKKSNENIPPNDD